MIKPTENRDDRPQSPVLVIGYGNTLRSDDGAGQKVVQIIDRWNLPQIRSLFVHQLTPELAVLLAEVELAFFIDVYCIAEDTGIKDSSIQVIRVDGQSTVGEGVGHLSDPQSLLYLTNLVYGQVPSAWWILIPAINFEFGEKMSALTTLGINKAVEEIKNILYS